MEQNLQYIMNELQETVKEQRAIYELNQRHGYDTQPTIKRINALEGAIDILLHLQCAKVSIDGSVIPHD